MNTEILQITEQLKEAYEGEPWFGRSIKSLLKDVDENIAFEKPNGQHSILELVWHIVIWRVFTINRLRNDEKTNLQYFEENDWQQLNHNDKTLWKRGLDRLEETQSELIDILQKQQDNILNEIVPGRKYTFRKLLYGIIHHDIYHIGQIAYLKKLFG